MSMSVHDFTAGFSQYFDKIIGHGDAQIRGTIALISDSTPIYLIPRFYC